LIQSQQAIVYGLHFRPGCGVVVTSDGTVESQLSKSIYYEKKYKKLNNKRYLQMIQRSIVSRERYSHDIVSVADGFKICPGLLTKLSFWSDL